MSADNRMLEPINKLRGRGFTELWFRGKQKMEAFSERCGLSSQSNLPTDAELVGLLTNGHVSDPKTAADVLLKKFRTGNASHFFASFDDPDTTKAMLQSDFAGGRQNLIKQAEAIVEGRFQIFGMSDLSFGNPIDWHREPLSGKRSPLVHWSRISEIDSETSGDKKIVWELNRHQYFSTLGRAYWATGDKKFAGTFATHLSQWMDQNPPKLGLNWMSSLEVGFRAISWLWALHFFKDAVALTPELYSRAIKYLYLHARHLETYLSTYSSPNTHLTGEALGLFYLGTVLHQFRDAAAWREKGRTILVNEFARQVLADGVYFERASYYHRYTTEFYTHFIILAERSRPKITDALETQLQSLLDHLMYITRPDGTSPLIGDDDGGRLAMLDESGVNDFRSLLATGASLFHRSDFKYVANEAAESTLWLLGPEGLRDFKKIDRDPPKSLSRAFPVAGYYVMRDGWDNDANFMLLDCGPHGALSCGHAHADALSFELVVRGRSLLVDPGTYTYTGSRELRDYFRSSGAHNTLTIDGQSSSVPAGPFSWKEMANASIIEWKSTARFDFLVGAHDGYERLRTAPATHTRSVLFLKNDYWIMRDQVRTDGAHEYGLNFHFAAGSDVGLEKKEGAIGSTIERTAGTSGLQIVSFAKDGDWRFDEGWVSSCYGSRTRAPVCTFSANGEGPQEFLSFLLPRRASEALLHVSRVEAIGGRAFEIRDEPFIDLLIISNGGVVETAQIATDFQWAWARFSRGGAVLEELVLVGGKRFSVNNREILNESEKIEYAVARSVDDKLTMEIDSRVLSIKVPGESIVTTSTPAIQDRRI